MAMKRVGRLRRRLRDRPLRPSGTKTFSIVPASSLRYYVLTPAILPTTFYRNRRDKLLPAGGERALAIKLNPIAHPEIKKEYFGQRLDF
ncbi:hypothetical protein N7509_011887 [Penicillium cosmopolitanum]|uniref:Uncharacterized protein n=1 Tax=Penicillium cosmopolitanum TaxID=1131564 RepID=A0A9W9SHN5_9EURO|nr:uncharacterized protein N7509_011887 [Penicillium cosmopolitanum]KAJ5378768.1 hypothetical protein N7509_011887 [Penicillium cosmopolitanum]